MIYPVNHLHFRYLQAGEVSVLPVETRNDKVKVLLYKDARSDRKILNETVGELNWQSDYFEEHGMLFCKVGIRNPETGEWTWKTDTGSGSNIEAEKGLASDAFKRACFAFGIGEELYTAPEIRIDLTEKDMYQGKLSQSFSVSEMSVEDGFITSLSIVDKWGKRRFEYNRSDSIKPIQAAPRNQIEQPVLADKPLAVEIPLPSDPRLAIKLEELDERYSCEPRSTPSPNQLIKEFYDRKKTEPGVNMDWLNGFYRFFTGPSNKHPNKSVAETWDNLNPEKAWAWWMTKKMEP